MSTPSLDTIFRPPLPGLAAQLRMAPAYRARPEHVSIEGKSCREAAVLLPLYRTEAGWTTLLTQRRADLPDHAGQISFPGGRRAPGETLEETALREAREEIGLDPALVVKLYPLTPLYIPPSNFCVYPFVALLRSRPRVAPCEREVEAILEIPLSVLMHPEAYRREVWTLRGQPVEVPFFAVEGHRIWGATAMILSELLAVMQRLPHRQDAPAGRD